MIYCLNCGKGIPDQSKFCTFCGTAIKAADPQQPADNTSPPVEQYVNTTPVSGPPINPTPLQHNAYTEPVVQPHVTHEPVTQQHVNPTPVSESPINPTPVQHTAYTAHVAQPHITPEPVKPQHVNPTPVQQQYVSSTPLTQQHINPGYTSSPVQQHVNTQHTATGTKNEFYKNIGFWGAVLILVGFFLPLETVTEGSLYYIVTEATDSAAYLYLIFPIAAALIIVQALTGILPRFLVVIFKFLPLLLLGLLIIGINNSEKYDLSNADFQTILSYIGIGLYMIIIGSILMLFFRTTKTKV